MLDVRIVTEEGDDGNLADGGTVGVDWDEADEVGQLLLMGWLQEMTIAQAYILKMGAGNKHGLEDLDKRRLGLKDWNPYIKLNSHR